MAERARVVASNGYALVRVGTQHHLADVRGYAYEHRVVAEQTIGRRLLPGELVHHKDGDKLNNAPSNLEVVTRFVHRVRHRRVEGGWRMPGESNPTLACACGCGCTFKKFDSGGRPRKYITGHNPSRRKLSFPDVCSMRAARAAGATYRQLATRFGISDTQVANIILERQRRSR